MPVILREYAAKYNIHVYVLYLSLFVYTLVYICIVYDDGNYLCEYRVDANIILFVGPRAVLRLQEYPATNCGCLFLLSIVSKGNGATMASLY